MLPAVHLESENTESKTWDWSWSELCACAMETDYIQTSVAWTTRNYAPVINCGASPQLGCCLVTFAKHRGLANVRARTLMKNPWCFEDSSGWSKSCGIPVADRLCFAFCTCRKWWRLLERMKESWLLRWLLPSLTRISQKPFLVPPRLEQDSGLHSSVSSTPFRVQHWTRCS